MTVGEKIQELLDWGGKNQKELAELSGVSQSAISDYIRNIRIPSIEAAQKIADALDRLFLVRPLHLQHGLASDRESERNQRQDAVELRLLAVAGFDGEGVVRKFLIDGVQNHTRRTAMDAGLVHYRENTFFHRRPF